MGWAAALEPRSRGALLRLHNPQGSTVDVEIVLTARSGGVAIRANDDVAVAGEQILLNCDRESPPPGWVPPGHATVPVTNRHGDPEVLRLLDET